MIGPLNQIEVRSKGQWTMIAREVSHPSYGSLVWECLAKHDDGSEHLAYPRYADTSEIAIARVDFMLNKCPWCGVLSEKIGDHPSTCDWVVRTAKRNKVLAYMRRVGSSDYHSCEYDIDQGAAERGL